MQDQLWQDERPRPTHGAVRRALDRDIRDARAAGRIFLESEVAAVRRQANDLDRLEAILEAGEGKPWDYNPKTTAHQAFAAAVRDLLGATDDDADPFVAAVKALDDAARDTALRDAEGSHPTD